jgi:hypothetical protein
LAYFLIVTGSSDLAMWRLILGLWALVLPRLRQDNHFRDGPAIVFVAPHGVCCDAVSVTRCSPKNPRQTCFMRVFIVVPGTAI